MSSLEKIIINKLNSAPSEEDLFQVTEIASNLLSQGSIEEPFFLYVCAVVRFRTGDANLAFTLLTHALDLAPDDAKIYVAKSVMIGSLRDKTAKNIMADFTKRVIKSIGRFKKPAVTIDEIFRGLGFTEAEDPVWKDFVFERFSLPVLQHLINERMYDMALIVEELVFLHYLRSGGTDCEARFTKSTRKWYPSMERLGKALAIEKKLKVNDKLRLHNNKIAFFIHSESMLAHVGTVFSILESYKQRGARGFEATIISFSGCNQEMRQKFESYNVQVISLQELFPASTIHQRYLYLKEFLVEQEIEILIWVCLTVHMSFAFGLRIAPIQIWYTSSYYRGLINKEIDKRVLTTVLADGVFEGGNRWDILNFSITSLCKNEADIRYEIESLKKSLLGDKFHNIIGVLAREQKLQDKSYIEAIAQVLKRNSDTLFVWTGTRHDETVQRYIRDFDIADQSKYIGWIDTSIYVHVLDVFMDTFPFPCGLTLYQAMAAGKASVSLRTDDAMSMGIHGQLSSVFDPSGDFVFEEERAARIRQIFGDDGHLFLLMSTVDEYVEAASLLISNRNQRTAVGDANRDLAEEFLLDPLKMSQSFDRIVGSYLR